MRKFALILTGFLVDWTGAEGAPGVWTSEAGEPEAFRKSVTQNFASDVAV